MLDSNASGHDQASGLRRLFGERPEGVSVISFVAAADGVGKTHAVINLAATLAARGLRVLILDENEGADNVGRLLGGTHGTDLQKVIEGRCLLSDVVWATEAGFSVCPAAMAMRALPSAGRPEQRYLMDAFASLPNPPDVILIDAAHDHPYGFSPLGLAAPETVVVLSATSQAITGAYALIKQVAQTYGRTRFRILLTKVKQASEANQIFSNLAKVAAQRKVAEMSLAAHIPADDAIAHAAWMNEPVVVAFPQSAAAKSFANLAEECLRWPKDQRVSGVRGLMEQLVHWTQRIGPASSVASMRS